MAYTVSQLNNIIKEYIDINPSLRRVQVIGEISNLKKHYTGHWYLTLKDENSRINAMVFASYASRIKIKVEDGMKVMITGTVSVYPQGGSYQIYIYDIDPVGVGALYMQYEALKKKLNEEGLFDLDKKKSFPKYPTNIGVISAPQGAAVRDVITTIRRRWPLTQITLLSSLVQGASAAPDVLDKLKKADNMGFDVIIVARGGGSIEDLWCFNDETVARFVYQMNTPIISAIGHETDFTILDFVADARAATPTAAAEIATPNIYEIRSLVDTQKVRMGKGLMTKIDMYKDKIDRIKARNWYSSPELLFVNKRLKCDNLMHRLNRSSEKKILDLKKIIEQSNLKLNNGLNNVIKTNKMQFATLVSKLDALSPLKVIQRGYGLIETQEKVVKSIKDVNVNENITIKVSDGKIKANVLSKEEK